MNQNSPDLLNLIDEINKSKNELNYILEIFKQNEKLLEKSEYFYNIYNEIDSLKNEIDSLKNEVYSLNEINKKSIDFFLLEIESALDSQKQFQNSNSSIRNLFKVDDNSVKKILDEKNQLINSLESKIEDFENIVISKDEEINSLNKHLSKLYVDLEYSEKLIGLLSGNESSELSELINLWDNKMHILKKESDEKENIINALKEEIDFLKNIINEKDKTIDFLRRE